MIVKVWGYRGIEEHRLGQCFLVLNSSMSHPNQYLPNHIMYDKGSLNDDISSNS